MSNSTEIFPLIILKGLCKQNGNMLLKADKCWIQVHEDDTVNYESYFKKLKKMDRNELACRNLSI